MKLFKTIFVALTLLLTQGNKHAYGNRKSYYDHTSQKHQSRRQDRRVFGGHHIPRRNRQNDPLMTDLHIAALRGQIHRVKNILKNEEISLPIFKYKRKKISERNSQEQTPLHLAIAGIKRHNVHIQEEIIKMLIAHGADVNAQAEMKKTPLHFAAIKGCLPIIKLLFKNGAHIDAPTALGETALSIVVPHGRKKIIEYLLDNGADVSRQHNKQRTWKHKNPMENISMIHDAVLKRQPLDIIELLVAYAEKQNIKKQFINARMKGGSTALRIAVTTGQIEVIKYLLKNGADIRLTTTIPRKNKYDIENATPLHVATIEKKPIEIIQILVKHAKKELSRKEFKRFINAQINDDSTALHIAANLGQREVIKYLLKEGANIMLTNTMFATQNKPEKKKLTVLHAAVLSNQPLEIIQMFVEHAKKQKIKKQLINAQTEDGETALNIAITKKQKDIVDYLLQNGSDIELTEAMPASKGQFRKENITVLHAALLSNQPSKMVLSLIENAKKQNNERKFKKFINAQMSDKSTALYIAVNQGKKEVVTCLLENGADIMLTSTMQATKDKPEIKNISTLQVALLSDQSFEMIQLLVEHAEKQKIKKQFINIQTHYGQTALNIAINKGLKSVVKYLIQNGAKTTLRCTLPALKDTAERVNVSSLHVALINAQSLEIIQSLVEYTEPNERAEFINAELESGSTALSMATGQKREGIKEIIDFLILNGANITHTKTLRRTKDQPVMKNVTLLHVATLSNQPFEIIQTLVEQAKKQLSKEELKAFINAQINDDSTALHMATTSGQKETIEYLLANGADITLTCNLSITKDRATETKNVTPLHQALLSNQPLEIIQLLVEHAEKQNIKKEFINAQTNHGGTALSLAIPQGRKELIKYLLENDANPNIQTNDKFDGSNKIRSPFQVLIRLHKNAAMKDENLDAHRYTSEEICNLITLFLEHGAHINLVNKHNQTPLHWLIRMQHAQELKTLIENSSQDNNLYEALKIECSERMHRFGITIWDTIEIFYNPEIIDILINTKNKVGKTLLDIAKKRNDVDVMAKLESYHLTLFCFYKMLFDKQLISDQTKNFYSVFPKKYFYQEAKRYEKEIKEGIQRKRVISIRIVGQKDFKNYLAKKLGWFTKNSSRTLEKNNVEKKSTIKIKKRNRQEKTYQLYKHKKLELRFDNENQTLDYRLKKNKDFQSVHSEHVGSKTMFILKHKNKQKFYYWYKNNKLKFRQSGTQQTYNLKLKN